VRFPSSPLQRNPLPVLSGGGFFVARRSPGPASRHLRGTRLREVALPCTIEAVFVSELPRRRVMRPGLDPGEAGLHVWQTVHQYNFLPPMSSITIASLPHTRHVWPTRP